MKRASNKMQLLLILLCSYTALWIRDARLCLLYYAEVMQNAYKITIGQTSFVILVGFYYHVVNQAISNDRSVRILYRPRMLIALFLFRKMQILPYLLSRLTCTKMRQEFLKLLQPFSQIQHNTTYLSYYICM